MLKKTITYTDFNGEEASEDFFFHMSKAELVELELSHEGGLTATLQRIVAAQDGKSIIAEFKNVILGAYGEKSEDGRRFIKNQALRDEFESSEAYSTLFMELVTDAGAAAEFVRAVIPQDVAEEAAKIAATDIPPTLPTPLAVAETSESTTVARSDLEAMDPEDFNRVMGGVTSGRIKVVD